MDGADPKRLFMYIYIYDPPCKEHLEVCAIYSETTVLYFEGLTPTFFQVKPGHFFFEGRYAGVCFPVFC